MSFDVGVSSSSINVYADMKRLQDYGMIKVFDMCWSNDIFFMLAKSGVRHSQTEHM